MLSYPLKDGNKNLDEDDFKAGGGHACIMQG